MKKIYNVCTTIIVIIAVTIMFLLVGIRIFGIQMYSVLSGSMAPTINTGDLVYVKDVKPEQVQKDDVITFSIDEETLATHRVVQIINQNDSISFKTKGDANQTEDSRLVTSKNLVGKVLFHIPKLGSALDKIHTGSGRIIAIGLGALVVLLVLLQDIFFPEEKKERHKETVTTESEA